MENLNHAFFEAFTRLERLCGDMYGTGHGVTKYIDHMKTVSPHLYGHIPNWEADLYQLIRLRHIRNDLAHTPGALDHQACTQIDIDWLQDFYTRILDRSDPIAILRQRSAPVRQVSQQPDIHAPNNKKTGNEMGREPSTKKRILRFLQFLLLTCIIGILLLLIPVIIVYIFYV